MVNEAQFYLAPGIGPTPANERADRRRCPLRLRRDAAKHVHGVLVLEPGEETLVILFVVSGAGLADHPVACSPKFEPCGVADLITPLAGRLYGRARVRSERQHRWGQPAARAA